MSKPRWSGVVKIQRCLYPPGGPVLISSEDMSVYEHFDESIALVELLGSELKVYHHAIIDDIGILDIQAKAGENVEFDW